MIDPTSTHVLKRRVGAALFDLGLVVFFGLGIWWSQVIRFPFTRDAAGDPAYSPLQIERRDQIAEGFNTEFIWNDTSYALDQTGLAITLLFGFLIALITLLLLPANTGWSPGKRIFGLRVTTLEGDPASLGAHTRRLLWALIDGIPFVLPGLAGWLVAARSEHRQRLGDRAANTVVIGASDAQEGTQTASGRTRRHDDDDDMIRIDDRLDEITRGPSDAPPPADALSDGSGLSDAALGESREPWVSGDVEGDIGVAPLDDQGSNAMAAAHDTRGNDTTAAEGAALADRSGHDDTWLDPVAPADADSPTDQGQGLASGVPAPSHRVPPLSHRRHEVWEQPVREPAPVWDPRRDPLALPTRGAAPTDEGDLALEADRSTADAGDMTRVGDTGNAGDSADTHRPDTIHSSDSTERTADFVAVQRANDATTTRGAPDITSPLDPAAVPAPRPAGEGNTEPSSTGGTSSTEETSSTEGTGLSGESLGTADAYEQSPGAARASDPGQAAGPGPAETENPSAEMVWNEDWQAWLYWDATNSQWLRHDPESGVWLPLG